MKKGIVSLLFFISLVTVANAQLVGIGITLKGEYACDGCDETHFVVAKVATGSAADKDGLKQGDIVETIDNIHLSRLDITEAYFLVAGKSGEKVTFGIKRGGKAQSITVKRKDNKNNSAGEQETIDGISTGAIKIYRSHLESIGMDPDGDGVFNDEDLCPNEKGNPDYMGCKTLDPEYDNDGDGVHNALDECPNYEGPKENKGCPVVEEEVVLEDETWQETQSGISEKDDSPFSQQLYILLEDARENFMGIKLEEEEGQFTSSWTVSICLPDATSCKVVQGFTGKDVYYAEYAKQVTEKEALDMYAKVKEKVITALGDDYTSDEKGTTAKEIVFKAKNTTDTDLMPNVAVTIEKYSGKYNVQLRIYR